MKNLYLGKSLDKEGLGGMLIRKSSYHFTLLKLLLLLLLEHMVQEYSLPSLSPFWLSYKFLSTHLEHHLLTSLEILQEDFWKINKHFSKSYSSFKLQCDFKTVMSKLYSF